MTKKIGDKKVTGVSSATETQGVQGTEAVSGIGKVKATLGIRGVGGALAIGRRRATRIMTAAEREQLFHMITEEADKLESEGVLPKRQKDVLRQAVKMAVDSGIVEDEKEE